MTEPTMREKMPNNCHVKRYAKNADKDRPAIKSREAMS